MTESDWAFSQMNWQFYIGQVQVSDPSRAAPPAQCSEDLLRRVYEFGDFSEITTCESMLDRMKMLVVRQIHRTVHIINMFEEQQTSVICRGSF